MELKLQIYGLDDVVHRLDTLSDVSQRKLKEAMNISLRDLQEEARSHHRFTTRTGEAERSIHTEATYGKDNFSGTVGTTRKVTVYLHQGTKRHLIRPKRKLALRWTAGGKFVFSKRAMHPGWRKDTFLFDALRHEQPRIMTRFQQAIREVIQEG